MKAMMRFLCAFACIVVFASNVRANAAENDFKQIEYFGSQVKFNGSASYSVRFVGTVDDIMTECTKLGFDIVWTWTEKNGATGSETIELEVDTVYTSVYGKGDYGQEQYIKDDLDNGHEYFYVASPSSKIYIDRYEFSNFEITPYAISADGQKVSYDKKSVLYHDGKVSDGTVTPKSEQIYNEFGIALNTVPELHSLSNFNPTLNEYQSIKAYWFDGMDRNGQKTKVFAYVGFPEGASESSQVPAVVLLHGGGGHAYLPWVKMWNDRGYAAIAIDHTGYFPTSRNAGLTETCTRWSHGLPDKLKEIGYVSAPNKDDMSASALNVQDMWMYHAVGQSILAGNILRADSRVDSDSVGICGISWGGVITSLTVGYDTRFAFAVPIYGSGYLDESLGWMGDKFSSTETQQLWLAQDRFENVDMPVLWLCWNDDSPFSINSNTKSYIDTVKNNSNTRIAMIDHMYHSHTDAWKRAEAIAFADSVVMDGEKLTGFVEQPTGTYVNVELDISPSVSSVSAKLYYITSPMTYSNQDKFGKGNNVYMTQTWQTKLLNISDGRISDTLPTEAKGYYIEITSVIGGIQYVTTSTFVTIG